MGAIIGTERQLSALKGGLKEDDWGEAELKPGVRTFGLISLYGTITIIFIQKYNLREFLIFSIASVIVIIAIYTAMKYSIKDFGITTPVALTLSYFLGVLIGIGELTLAITLSVLITFILTSKEYVKSLLEGVEFREIRSALEIGILFFLLLPIVPNTLDPLFHSINLRTFYLFLVIVLSLSFIAYLAVKKLSPLRGTVTFSTLGALFSSEGVTVSLIRIYRENRDKNIEGIITQGILLANVVMIIRTLILSSLLLYQYVNVIVDLAYFIFPSILLGLFVSYRRFRKKLDIGIRKIEIENPLSYTTAAKFVIVFIVISFAVVFLERYFTGYGIIFGSFIGGFVSNLAVSLSVASLLINGEISTKTAEVSILFGTLSAILNKIIYAGVESENKTILKNIILDVVLITVPLILVIIYLLFY